DAKPRDMGDRPEPTFTAPLSNRRANAQFKLVGIVSSTGGLAAVTRVLRDLPSDFDVPIAVVQHTGDRNDTEFVRLLARELPFVVRLVAGPTRPRNGTIYVGPQGSHLVVDARGQLCLTAEPHHPFMPSGDVFFASMAEHLGARAIGVVLTGMGGDGA